jgi:hypothetical protein
MGDRRVLFGLNGPEHEAHLVSTVCDPLQLSDCNRAISRAADVGCHAASGCPARSVERLQHARW